MRRKLRWFLVLTILVLATNVVSRAIWHRRVDQLLRTLDSPHPDRAPAAPVPAGELPLPVARYLALAIFAEGRQITAAEIDTSGQFLVSEDGAWSAFHARQRFNTRAPGFVWDARIFMAPHIPVFVRDSYRDGHAEMAARVLAAYPVVNERDSDSLAAGELVRYVAEMMWFPTALRSEGGVRWTSRDDRSAIAHFANGRHEVSLTFVFNEISDVVEVSSADRLRAVGREYVPTPWAVTCSEHERRLGMRIPVTCQAEWRPSTGRVPYWRGHVDSVRFEY